MKGGTIGVGGKIVFNDIKVIETIINAISNEGFSVKPFKNPNEGMSNPNEYEIKEVK